MKKFEILTQPEELDFFRIYEEDGIKHIHIFGYVYENESDGYWASMECSGFIEQLSEFVEHYQNYKTDSGCDYTDEAYCECSQNQEDYTAEKMTEIINSYFDGQPADFYLDFKDITIDTPCGNYVCDY